ncbi:ferredoxin reductase family protein [Streptomyces mangrovisoli]|uniref:FAD-binding FR-type domain-containing protein n=1 Tax=Streptomyces mangrovisoli TaxID=1428628 RepID=A0A1J4NQ17_9ACTN|nr:ferredoxin reductase family protein [Streptomyces mangrovisoli]OIJ64403.1 hypothetical protein WN71_028945 [Streptomyces mangrovisoli]
MPFLVAIAIYAVRIARSPLDLRLKRRHAGPLTVAALGVTIYLAWDWLQPDGIARADFIGEFCGVAAVYLMTCSLVLATRLRPLEQWFGGLDRMYFFHKQYAIWSFPLLFPHALITGGDKEEGTAAQYSTEVAVAHELGAFAFMILLLLVVISLARVGRLLRLRHAWWLFLHRLTGLLVIAALVHGWILDPVIDGSPVLRALYCLIGAVGTAAYAYDELIMRRRAPKAAYVVSAVDRPADDVVDLVLTPTAPAPLAVRGGQFVYLRVGGHRAWREHPFTVAGVGPDGSVRLTVRALGRGTRRLYADLATGAPATLTGPYGMFDHTVGGARQIWIAGGIGIAPFLGWITDRADRDLPRADLFYCTRTADDAPFLPELAEEVERHPGLSLHAVHSHRHGRLTLKEILTVTGPLPADVHVFLCGPARMVADLSLALRRHGLSRHHVHAEHFAFR